MHMRGFSLIEVMIAMVLGLIVAGAAVALFSTSRMTYTVSENMGRIQEANRTAFDLMSRDIRDAGGNPCDNTSTNYTMSTGLNSPTSHWWSDWGSGMVGYASTTAFSDSAFGTSAGQRVSGTDAIELKGGDVIDTAWVTTANTSASSNISVKSVADVVTGDLLILCDYYGGTIFQVTGFSGNTIKHANTGTPGNTSGSLVKVQATGPLDSSGNEPPLVSTNASISRLRATRWYIGCNGRVACSQPGGRSLYQSSLKNTAGTLSVATNEIASGASGMTLQYLTNGATAYVAAGSVSDWSKVTAVKIDITFSGQDKVGTNGSAVTRVVEQVVSLRNHTT